MPELLLMLFTTGAINEVYGILMIGLIIIIPWQFMKTKKSCVNGMISVPFFVLAIFCVLYVLLGELNIQGILYYFICPLLAYLTGWTMIEVRKKEALHFIKWGVTALFLGYTVHAFLNYSINIGHPRWELYDYFTGSLRGATGSGSVNTIILSLAAYIIVFEKNRLKKCIGLGCVVISLLYAFLLGTRTQFIIFAIVSFVFLATYLYETFGYKSVAILSVITLGLIGIGYYLYTYNVFGVATFIDASNLMERYQVGNGLQNADSYRTSSISRGLENLLYYPLGGLKDTSYYHNLWLDIGRVSGILPFIFMVAYTMIVNMHVIRIIKDKYIESSFRYLVMSVYLGIQINFLVEPILEGLLHMFLVFILLNGMIEFYYQRILLTQKEQCRGGI